MKAASLIKAIEEFAKLGAELVEELMLAFIGVKPPRRSRRAHQARVSHTTRHTAPRVIYREAAPRVYVVKKQVA